MSVTGNPQSNLAVVPLGAGDLIDRAVRFYRKYFWTFILIASPPVIVGTIVSVGWTFAGRQIFSIGTDRYSAETTFYYIFLWFGSVVIWLTETIATLVVMGGASRNFVRHLLFGEAITFRETYRNAARRLGGLIFASSLISVLLGSVGLAIFYFAAMVLLILIGLIIWAVGAVVPVVGFILSVAVGLIVAGAALIMALLTRMPGLVWAGAALLGWVAGEVMATDPAIVPYLKAFFNGPVGVALDSFLAPLRVFPRCIAGCVRSPGDAG